MRRKIALIVASALFISLIPFTMPTVSAESNGVISVTIGDVYDIYVNPYMMAIETADGTVSNNSVVSSPTTLTNNNTAAPLKITAYANAETTGEVILATMSTTKFVRAETVDKYAFFLLQLRDTASNDEWIDPADYTEDTDKVVLVGSEILDAPGNTASVTVAAGGMAEFRIIGDCNIPTASGAKVWTDNPIVLGDKPDGVTITIVLDFELDPANYTVTFEFIDDSRAKAWTTEENVRGVFVDGVDVTASGIVQPVGSELSVEIRTADNTEVGCYYILSIFVLKYDNPDSENPTYERQIFDIGGDSSDYVDIISAGSTSGNLPIAVDCMVNFSAIEEEININDDVIIEIYVGQKTSNGSGSSEGGYWWADPQ